jgi:hypothetical protein
MAMGGSGGAEHLPPNIIEVQSGSYVGEDDIVRLSDDYRGDASPGATDAGRGPRSRRAGRTT